MKKSVIFTLSEPKKEHNEKVYSLPAGHLRRGNRYGPGPDRQDRLDPHRGRGLRNLDRERALQALCPPRGSDLCDPRGQYLLHPLLRWLCRGLQPRKAAAAADRSHHRAAAAGSATCTRSCTCSCARSRSRSRSATGSAADSHTDSRGTIGTHTRDACHAL